jgi:hypothetical protein
MVSVAQSLNIALAVHNLVFWVFLVGLIASYFRLLAKPAAFLLVLSFVLCGLLFLISSALATYIATESFWMSIAFPLPGIIGWVTALADKNYGLAALIILNLTFAMIASRRIGRMLAPSDQV